MELKKNWNSNGNIAGGDRLQLLGFCLGQTYSTCVSNLHVRVLSIESINRMYFGQGQLLVIVLETFRGDT